MISVKKGRKQRRNNGKHSEKHKERKAKQNVRTPAIMDSGHMRVVHLKRFYFSNAWG
jgi:hypothetical protein